MIDCDQARNLFDAHLNDEISSSWTAELHAHAVACGSCRRELSLLRACGDVIARDAVAPMPSSSFTDSVMAATATVRGRTARWNRWRSLSVWGGAGATAAAAAIMLWFTPLGSEPTTLVPQGIVRGHFVDGPSQQTFEPALFPVRAMRATQQGAQAIQVLGQYGLNRFGDVLGGGLLGAGLRGLDAFGGTGVDPSVGALSDLLRILHEQQQADADDDFEVM